MAAPKGFLVVPIAFRSDGTIRGLELTDLDELKVSISSTILATLASEAKLELVRLLLVSIAAEDFATQTTVNALLTELKLKADYNETQPVSASALPLPTGAATSAAQATMETEVGKNLKSAEVELVTKALSVGLHGWIGGAWQRQAMPFGISRPLGVPYTNYNLDSGVASYEIAEVSADEIWVVTNVVMRYVGTPPTYMRTNFEHGGTSVYGYGILAPTSGAWYDKQTWWVMEEGDKAIFYLDGHTTNDDFFAHISGFIIDIDQ